MRRTVFIAFVLIAACGGGLEGAVTACGPAGLPGMEVEGGVLTIEGQNVDHDPLRATPEMIRCVLAELGAPPETIDSIVEFRSAISFGTQETTWSGYIARWHFDDGLHLTIRS